MLLRVRIMPHPPRQTAPARTRFGLWASYAFGQPLPQNQPGIGVNAFAHESGIHADGAFKDRQNYELYDDEALGVPAGLVRPPLTDDELRLIAGYPRELTLLYPGQL